MIIIRIKKIMCAWENFNDKVKNLSIYKRRLKSVPHVNTLNFLEFISYKFLKSKNKN